MKIKLKPILLAIAALFFLPPKGASTDFNQQLCDSTLRIDYILSGNSNNQRIALHKLSATPGWAGRRVNLDSLPMRGNGQLELLDAATGKRLYAMSFSTLFQEWLTTDEARDCERSFENTFQIPMPVDKAVARLVLLDERGDTIANHSATIDHSDILIQRSKPDRLPDFRYISQGGDPARAIDVAIVAEGYQADEMDKFYTRAAEAVESLRNHEPFGSRFNDFNFIAVATPSADSGVSIPRLNEWRNTAVGSRFSTFYSNRYLTTPNVFHLHDLLQGIPYEHIIILANTDEYGGGGIYNSYTLTTADHPGFRPVVVHEFGHSFGGLADEYAYDGPDIIIVPEQIDYEPWEKNITSLFDFSKKWADKVDSSKSIPTPAESASDTLNDIGAYQGANYSTTLFYRPAVSCRMRDNDIDGFCPVCRDILNQLIDFYTVSSK